MHKATGFFVLCLALNLFSEALAEGLDIGIGLGFADSANSEGFDGGWDIQVGYEMKEKGNWSLGAQLHFINGWTSRGDVDEDKEDIYAESTSMAFNSQALYLTARPKNWWLQFRAGLVHASYYTIEQDVNSVGVAVGAGLVIGSEKIRLHILDYNRYQIGSDSFNVYTISLGVFY